MKKFIKWFLGTIAVIIGLFLLILIIAVIGASKDDYINGENLPKEDLALISIAKYGKDYPYTIDNLTLKCENDAVWVEDSALNKYALNGLANNKFQGRSDYKGYTNIILKQGKSDSDILSKGLELCN